MHGFFSLKKACLFGTLLFIAAQNSFSQDYSLWAKSKEITINTAADGYNIGTDLANFPYLVRLSKDSFNFSEAKGNGDDIRFTNKSGTALYFEVEAWDSLAGKAAIWVAVDTIRGNNADQSIKMYWGKADASSESNGAKVFDTANGFTGVWHLNDNPGNGANSLKDRTLNGHDGTPNGTVDGSDMSSVSGVIGKSINFNGTDNFISVSNPSSIILGNSDVTVSAWIKTLTSDAQGILTKSNNGAHEAGDKLVGINYSSSSFGIDQGWVANLNGSTVLNSGVWSYVTWVQKNAYSGTDEGWWTYSNGIEDGFRTAATLDDVAGHTVFIGGAVTGSYFPSNFKGQIDELCISRVARSADWIKLCFLNQQVLPDSPPTISYSVKDTTIKYNELIDPITPTIEGIVDSVTISPLLPDFFVVDKHTGVISGWTDELYPKTTYIITAWNVKGSSKDTIDITIASDETGIKNAGTKIGSTPKLIGLGKAHPYRVFFSVNSPKNVGGLEFSLCNLNGARVWSSKLSGSELRCGIQSIGIEGRSCIHPGMYVLGMKVKGQGSGGTFVENARVMIFR